MNTETLRRRRVLFACLASFVFAVVAFTVGVHLFLSTHPKLSGGGVPDCHECSSADRRRMQRNLTFFDCCPPGYAEAQEAKLETRTAGVAIAISAPFALAVGFGLFIYWVILARRSREKRPTSEPMYF